MEYRYNAIVLGKRETGETDRLYTLYTEEAGKVSAIAKGVRKPTAKLSAQLENGSRIGVTVIRTRGIGKIAGAIAEENFSALREDFRVYQSFLATLDRVRILTEPDECDADIFQLLKSFLEIGEGLMKKGEREKFFFLREAFLLKFYSILGYRIDTSRCVATGEKLDQEKRYVFSPRDGACVVLESAHQYPQSIILQKNTIKLLRLIFTNSLASLLKLADAPKETKNIAHISEALYRWTIRH